VAVRLWRIWKTHNNKVFRDELLQPMAPLIRAKKASAEWRIRHKLTLSLHPPIFYPQSSDNKQSYWVAWRKPQYGFIKVNFDRSKSSNQAAGGFVLRNWEGKFIQVVSFNLGATSILVAEATTMRNGLRVAAQAGYTDIQLEGDNTIPIQAAQGHM